MTDRVTHAHSGFTEPQTLKDILDFVKRLNGQAQLRNQVIKEIEDRLEDFFSVTTYPSKNNTNSLIDALTELQKLRNEIIKNPENPRESNVPDASCEKCVKECTDTLIKWLPKLHSELWLLYFQCGTEFSLYGGFGWISGRSTVSGTAANIRKWLTSSKGTTLVAKGFADGEVADSIVVTKLAGFTGLNFYEGGPLNFSQYGLFLLSPDGSFQHSNLASAILFLDEFCKEMNKENKGVFQNKNTSVLLQGKDIKDVCKKLTENLKPFTGEVLHPLYSPEKAGEGEDDEDDDEEEHTDTETPKSSSEAKPRTTVQTFHNMYKGKLKGDALEKYTTWIKNNLKGVIEALNMLQKDSSDWNMSSLTGASSLGPFKYGFVFKDSNWDSEITFKLRPHVDRLTAKDNVGSLRDLLSCFTNDLPELPKPAEETRKRTKKENKGRVSDTRGTQKTQELPTRNPDNHRGTVDPPPVRVLPEGDPAVPNDGTFVLPEDQFSQRGQDNHPRLKDDGNPSNSSFAGEMPISPVLVMMLLLFRRLV